VGSRSIVRVQYQDSRIAQQARADRRRCSAAGERDPRSPPSFGSLPETLDIAARPAISAARHTVLIGCVLHPNADVLRDVRAEQEVPAERTDAGASSPGSSLPQIDSVQEQRRRRLDSAASVPDSPACLARPVCPTTAICQARGNPQVDAGQRQPAAVIHFHALKLDLAAHLPEGDRLGGAAIDGCS